VDAVWQHEDRCCECYVHQALTLRHIRPAINLQALEGVQWPAEFPFSAEDFQRYDESPDTFFYGQPRYVTHIDDKAIAALTK
jgi:hypothetical protein